MLARHTTRSAWSSSRIVAGVVALLLCGAAALAQAPGMASAAQTNLRDVPLQPLKLTTPSMPDAWPGFFFNSSVRTEGGFEPYTITVSGQLPDGITAQVGFNVVVFSGIPTTGGTYQFEVAVTDAAGAVTNHPYSLFVHTTPFGNPAPAVIADPETIHTTDTDSVFFPAVIAVSETFHTTDSLTDFGSAQVADAETLHTTDTVAVTTQLGVTPTTTPTGIYNTGYTATIFQAVGNTGSATLTESGTLPTGMQISAPGSALLLYGTPTQIGTFPFTISAKDSVNTSVVNYTLIINTSSQTITIGTLPSPTYGGAAFTLTASSTSSLPVAITSTSALATGSNPFTPVSAGLASFQATQAGNTNYAAATPVNFNVTIGKASLTATATSASRVFDQPNPTFGYSLATFVNGDTASVVSGSPTISTAATPISPVTTYPITLAVGTLSAANYNIGAAPGTLTITKAQQTITFYPLPTLTHGSTFPLSARASSGIAVTYTFSGPASITNNILSVTGTGLVQVTAVQAGNTNYSAATSVIRSFTAQ